MFLFKRRGVYHVEYLDQADNRIRRITTATKNFQEAITFLTEFKSKWEAISAINSISIGDFIERYTAFLENGHSNHYLRSVKSTFRILTRFLEKNKRTKNNGLQSLDVSLLERFFGERFKESPSGAALYYRTLKAALSKAIEWEYLSTNPAKKIKRPKVAKKLPVFISESELEAICSNTERPQLADVFRFAFHTGMRLSEILNLEWKSVNMADRIIKVANTEDFTTKSKSERIIPINKTLFQVLVRIQPKIFRMGRNYVFPKQAGQSYSVDYISHKFKKAARLAGIGEDIHFHSLRHSFASNLIRRGVPIVTVKELLGHADISTTMIYSHVRRDDLVSAVKVLEK